MGSWKVCVGPGLIFISVFLAFPTLASQCCASMSTTTPSLSTNPTLASIKSHVPKSIMATQPLVGTWIAVSGRRISNT